MSDAIRVLIVEDDVVLRARLVEILSGTAPFEVAGEADTVADARALLERAPAVALIDLGLPDGHGSEVIAAIRKQSPGCKILVLSVFEDSASVLGALRSGADGYILKDTPPEQVIGHIRETLDGQSPISARAASHVLKYVRTQQDTLVPDPVEPDPALPALSPREKELLEHLARGMARKEAARKMGISPFTVGEYLQSVYRKLSVNSRGEAVYEALNARLIDIPRPLPE